MPKRFRLLNAMAIVTAAASLGVMAITTGAAYAATSWAVETTPSNDFTILTSVSCVAASDCVAVGNNAVYRGNDTSFTALSVPSGNADFTGIACTSTSYCIVVGALENNKTEHVTAAAWSWNGSKWTEQSTYNPKSDDNILNAIRCAGPTSCEAVGEHGDGDTSYPLAEHWNGTAWSDQSTTGAPTGELSNVSCESGSTCEAVGFNSYSSGTLAMALDGSTWVSQKTPKLPILFGSPPNEPYAFTSVSCYSGGCTAVGYQDYCDCSPEASGSLVLAETWNGTKWALQSPLGTGDPRSTSTALWNAVHCTSPSSCTAVGGWTDDNEAQPMLTLADVWNGSTWVVSKTPSPGGQQDDTFPGDELDGLSCTATTCTAVGSQVTNSNYGSLAMRD